MNKLILPLIGLITALIGIIGLILSTISERYGLTMISAILMLGGLIFLAMTFGGDDAEI